MTFVKSNNYIKLDAIFRTDYSVNAIGTNLLSRYIYLYSSYFFKYHECLLDPKPLEGWLEQITSVESGFSGVTASWTASIDTYKFTSTSMARIF